MSRRTPSIPHATTAWAVQSNKVYLPQEVPLGFNNIVLAADKRYSSGISNSALAMSKKTTSEMLFEQFCESNSLLYERVPTGDDPSPDYCVKLEAGHVYFEVKEIERDDAFSSKSPTRTVGDHIRAKINEARNQVRAASAAGSPTVLLVYNNLDPLQKFGTEEHDFLAAM